MTQLAGVEVRRVGLGTNRLTTSAAHVDFIRDAVAAGVGHIDTAHLYTNGVSEAAVGAALGGRHDGVQNASSSSRGSCTAQRPCCPFRGTLSVEPLRENLAALDLRLSAEDLAER